MENTIFQGFIDAAESRFYMANLLIEEDEITLDLSTIQAAREIESLILWQSSENPIQFKKWLEYANKYRRGLQIFQHSLFMSGGLVGESPWFDEFPEIAQIVCDFWAGREVFLSSGKIHIK